MIRSVSQALGRLVVGGSLLALVAGCSVFKSDLDVQKRITERVVGMPSGDFFQKYGTWRQRDEQIDGTVEYEWFSVRGATLNSGYYGLDDRICRLRLVAARSGRIATATVIQDAPGRVTTSRCGEVFGIG